MEKITSRENAKVKYACRLASSGAFRRAEGRFLAEGRKLCPELCRGAELETLFCTESALEKCPELSELPGEHYLVEDHVADKLADPLGMNYSSFMAGLKKAGIELNRKMLSEMAINDPKSFAALVETVKNA